MTKDLELGQQVPPASVDTLICQVDHIARHPHGLFGFGWALEPTGLISKASLELFYGADTVTVEVSTGRPREDVAMAFPDHPQAPQSGFMVMAGWGDTPPDKAEFVFELSDGRLLRRDLAVAVDQATPHAGVSEWRYLLKRAWAYLRQGKIAHLLYKSIRYGRRNPRLKSFDEVALAARVAGRRCRVLIDHSMGGGANHFREAQVAEWLSAGETIILLSFRMASMTAFVEVRDRKGSMASELDSIERLATIVESARVIQIFFNCAVSFPRPQQVRDVLLDIKRQSGAELVVAMHEYFLVCPSQFLLDSTGNFCGVPSLEVCDSCLNAHEDGFVSLTGERSVRNWRALWGDFLAAADEVRCFSQSTLRLLARAYPEVAARATLRPHKVEPLRPVSNSRLEQSSLVVGVIGAISHHKGAGVVAALANAIVDMGAAVKIVVIGSVDAVCPPTVVEQTGPYSQDDLPNIVEQHKINIALLPSICPETFSYVAHEIVSMGVPLMCLDLGAQADLARSQIAGRVSSRQDGSGLLEEIIAFDRFLHPLSLKVIS